jgi:hypothetical protein
VVDVSCDKCLGQARETCLFVKSGDVKVLICVQMNEREERRECSGEMQL